MLVWRIREGSTQGEWVDPEVVPPTSLKKKVLGARADTWTASSFDLFNGCDVSEISDTVPGDLFEELFAPRDDPPKTTGK